MQIHSHYLLEILSFSVVKANLICLNCHWVNTNPLNALIKFQEDLTRYKINHIWPDLVTEQKFNNKTRLSGLIPGCLWHRQNILAFCITKLRTFIPTEVVEESFFTSLRNCLISELEFVDSHRPKHDSWKMVMNTQWRIGEIDRVLIKGIRHPTPAPSQQQLNSVPC